MVGDEPEYSTRVDSNVPRDAHDGALSGGVAPRLVIGGENSHVAAAHKVVVVEAKQGIRRGEKLGVENHLDAISPLIEQLAPADA